MKVRVTLTVDIDPYQWRDIYGSGTENASEIRADVKRYAYHQLQDSAAAQDGAILDVEAR